MPLQSGTRVGPYEIVSPIGAGGMGEVYRARDPRLARDVAVKICAEIGRDDKERLERFAREARATGSLNHPNILAIYDLGEHDGTPYLVSELLDGETLADRLTSGPLPVNKALELVVQVAAGLGAAHAKGIIHRDLKPANLFVTRDGRVKILDFGLAKLTPMPTDAGNLTSLTTTAGTQAGLLLGTLSYMSPEQVRGQPVDQRSDLFSLGVVLYEMICGHPPFRRSSAIESLHATLNDDVPAFSQTQGPFGLEPIVRRCLEKQPDERFQSARDLEFHLSTLMGRTASAPGSGLAQMAPPGKTGGPSPRRARVLGGLALAAMVALTAAGFVIGQRSGGAKVPSFTQLTFRRGYVQSARFTADGHTLVYSASWDGDAVKLFSMRSERPESQPLPFSGAADILAISPSGEMAISLFRDPAASHPTGPSVGTTLARVPIVGGGPREILEDVRGADWAPDGERLAVVHVVEGRDRLEFPIGNVIAETDGWFSHPRVSPDGATVAFIEHPLPWDDRGAIALIGPDGARRRLTSIWESAYGLAWAPGGDELWFTASAHGPNSDLYAVDLAGTVNLLASSPGRLVLHDVSPEGQILMAQGKFRLRLVYGSRVTHQERDLSWLDASSGMDLTSDGRTVLFVEQGSAASPGSYALYSRKTDRSPAVWLANAEQANVSPDGARVATIVRGPPESIEILPMGAGEARRPSRGSISDYESVAWLPGGDALLLSAAEDGRDTRLYTQELDGEPVPLTDEGVRLHAPGNPVSPDGSQIVALDRDDRVWLYSTRGGAARPMPGVDPGDAPVGWSEDGRSIFVFRPGDLPSHLYRVSIDDGDAELLQELVPSDPGGVHGIGAVLVTPDGQHYAYTYAQDLSDLYLVDGLN